MQLITPGDAAGRVTAALKSAAEATGAGFDYLLSTARRESSLNPAAQAPTSSARGLFQFIDQTWLEVLKEEGPKLGLGEAAADVSKTGAGRYVVQDPARKAELLAMRDDPNASALLAGAFTRRNAAAMESALGRSPTEGELYAAHFLGAQGATELVKLASATPESPAAAAFPAQAAANRAIFYDKARARSAAEVYGKLTTAAGGAAAPAPVATAVASFAAPRTVEPEARAYNGGVENDGAAFHSMFKTGRRSPVSAYVAQAWSSFGSAGLVSDTAGAATPRTAVAAKPSVAAAYAAQPVSLVVDTPAKAQAAAAVTGAAQGARKRAAPIVVIPVPTAAPVAAALAETKPADAKPLEAKPSDAKPVDSGPTDLFAFLRANLFAPRTDHASRRGARP